MMEYQTWRGDTSFTISIHSIHVGVNVKQRVKKEGAQLFLD